MSILRNNACLRIKNSNAYKTNPFNYIKNHKSLSSLSYYSILDRLVRA
jgi:hypothetical protein